MNNLKYIFIIILSIIIMQNSFAQVKVSNIDTDTKEKTKQSLL